MNVSGISTVDVRVTAPIGRRRDAYRGSDGRIAKHIFRSIMEEKSRIEESKAEIQSVGGQNSHARTMARSRWHTVKE